MAEEFLLLKELIKLVSYWALASTALAIREDSIGVDDGEMDRS